MIYELRIYRYVPERKPMGGKIQKAWLDVEVVQSCRRRWQATRIRLTPISMPPCRAISAAVEPVCASVKQSSTPLNEPDAAFRSRSRGVAVPRATAR
jgi:hypothetical protein